MMWKKSKVLFVSIICIITTLMVICGGNTEIGEAASADGIIITVKSSPEAKFSSTMEVHERQFLRSITKSKKSKAERVPDLPYAYLTVNRGNNRSEYVVDYSLSVFNLADKTQLQLSTETKEKLNHFIQQLEAKHYGEPLTWDAVKQILPRKGTAQVIDLESGLSFNVQRRAGNRHADVQPVTREDSHTMKEIYSGKWSWKRRAILVKVGGRAIAASMNGMPHGAGAIKGNDFPGHFCIHFEGSTTHKMRKQDPGHHLMIQKASGRLHEYIVAATPSRLVDLLITALHEQDFHIVRLTLNQSNPTAVEEFIELAKNIEGIRITEKEEEVNLDLPQFQGPQEVKIPSKISIHTSEGKRLRKDIELIVTRDALLDRWRIDAESLLLSIRESSSDSTKEKPQS
ncbi:hypothetical protein [Effusibacillus consociatus]|uniref:Uncharacterized protein n=1 Tax=Effusibacillus consociatus TaxID=1117041 RepID=A0ABV9PYF4_9BACL